MNSVEGSKPPPSPASVSFTLPRAVAKSRGDILDTRANLSYLDALAKFHKQQGNNLNRLPYVDKKPLDLYRLKKAVEARGGFDKVCKHKKWAEIGRDLGYSGKIMSSLSTSLKNSYQRWLCPYEDYLRLAKPVVHQQLEHEYGGPFTPSPAPSPMKRSNVNTPSGPQANSPARLATDALQTTMNGHSREAERDIPMLDAPAAAAASAPAVAVTGAASALAPASAPQLATSGFTAINSSGFTAVNAGFTSVNRQPPPAADSKTFTPPKHNGSPFAAAPDYRPSGLGPGTAMKRQLSYDSVDAINKDGCVDKEGVDNGSRRSKRIKKGRSIFSSPLSPRACPIHYCLYPNPECLLRWQSPVLLILAEVVSRHGPGPGSNKNCCGGSGSPGCTQLVSPTFPGSGEPAAYWTIGNSGLMRRFLQNPSRPSRVHTCRCSAHPSREFLRMRAQLRER